MVLLYWNLYCWQIPSLLQYKNLSHLFPLPFRFRDLRQVRKRKQCPEQISDSPWNHCSWRKATEVCNYNILKLVCTKFESGIWFICTNIFLFFYISYRNFTVWNIFYWIRLYDFYQFLIYALLFLYCYVKFVQLKIMTISSLNKSRIIVLLILVSFIFSGESVYSLFQMSCSKDETSCCCKKSALNDSENISKKCCCEIKEADNHVNEIILITNEVSRKSDIYFVLTLIKPDNFIKLNFSGNYGINSFHSPPDTDINIFNSVLRI